MRPTPLYSTPEVVGVSLNIDPLDPFSEYTDTDYLATHLKGDVAVVAQEQTMLNRFESDISEFEDVDSVCTRHSPASSKDQLKTRSEQLFDPSRRFDSIVLYKHTMGFFARSFEFKRLTPFLKTGGTLLAKTKWVADSDEVTLDSITVVGEPDFEHEDFYLKYTKTDSKRTPAEYLDTDETPDGSVSDQDRYTQLDFFGDPHQSKEWESQYQIATDKTEFTPGWRWHSQLEGFATQWADRTEGSIANLCCGQCPIGDIRIDQAETIIHDGERYDTAATHIMDATDLDLSADSVGGVITDPPWKVPVSQRIQLFSEAARIVRPGGKILHNATWVPYHPYCKLTELHACTANVDDDSIHQPGNVSFLAEFEVGKIPNFGEDYRFTLSNWARLVGDSRVYAALPDHCHPYENPAADPRIASPSIPTPCIQCGSHDASARYVHSQPVYDCDHCGFPNTGSELLAEI